MRRFSDSDRASARAELPAAVASIGAATAKTPRRARSLDRHPLAARLPVAGDRGGARLAAQRQGRRGAGALRRQRGSQRHRGRPADRRHPRQRLPPHLRGRRGPARPGGPPRAQRGARVRPHPAAGAQGAPDRPHRGPAGEALDRDCEGPRDRRDHAPARNQAAQAAPARRGTVRMEDRRAQPGAALRLRHHATRAGRRCDVLAPGPGRRTGACLLRGGFRRRRAEALRPTGRARGGADPARAGRPAGRHRGDRDRRPPGASPEARRERGRREWFLGSRAAGRRSPAARPGGAAAGSGPGPGRIGAKVTATLEKSPVWDLQFSAEKVDPGALSARAPKGEVTGRLSLHGKGRPRFDAHGVEGELRGAVHVGPAQLDRVGPVVADMEASLLGRYAIIRAFTATALGLKIEAHGAAAYDELSLDVDLRAEDLAHVGRAIGATTRQPSLPMAGSAHLVARVTGAPRSPNASLRLRAPRFRWGGTLDADGLAVDGTLSGSLERPDGSLHVTARQLSASAIDLGAPRADVKLEWPLAHLRIDAAVAGGNVQLAGDAKIDDDKDGLLLSNFEVAWPGNTLRLARDGIVRFRDELVLEPVDLVGEHGSVRLQAQVQPPPGRID